MRVQKRDYYELFYPEFDGKMSMYMVHLTLQVSVFGSQKMSQTFHFSLINELPV